MLIKYSTVLLAVAIGILPVLVWMFLIVKKNHIQYAKSGILLGVFFWGVLTAIPASLLQIFLIESGGETYVLQKAKEIFSDESRGLILGAVASSLVVAFIEEFSKGAAIVFSFIKTRIFGAKGGLLFGMIVGLAFGVTENGVYFASAMRAEQGAELVLIVILRFLLSTSAHIIYSGMMGVLLAEAWAAEKKLIKAVKFILALFFPIGVHAMFNFVLGTQYNWLSIFIISAGLAFLWMKFSSSCRGEKK